MTQMQSKVSFYEGQVDPLLQDNDSLKDHSLQILGCLIDDISLE